MIYLWKTSDVGKPTEDPKTVKPTETDELQNEQELDDLAAEYETTTNPTPHQVASTLESQIQMK